MKRRRFIAAGGATLALSAWPAKAQRFQPPQDIRPLVEKLTGGASAEKGGVEIEIPQLAENGHSVPLRIRVPSPMRPGDHVAAIHVIAGRNPRPHVATFRFVPESGKAEVSTRVRLAGSQKLTVLAELSGRRFRMGEAQVHVTAAACLDEASL